MAERDAGGGKREVRDSNHGIGASGTSERAVYSKSGDVLTVLYVTPQKKLRAVQVVSDVLLDLRMNNLRNI